MIYEISLAAVAKETLAFAWVVDDIEACLEQFRDRRDLAADVLTEEKQ